MALTDEHGYLIDRYRFDPFGTRRIATYDGLPGSTENLTKVTNRGFTGHRELIGVGLIHMKGRVYDPGLGRFMSADPFIQSPLYTQSYNRYSYVWNSPVNGTDPSGYITNAEIQSNLESTAQWQQMQQMSGVEIWTFIGSDKYIRPEAPNTPLTLGQANARRDIQIQRANRLIRAELPGLNRNFSSEELYSIATGKTNIGLSSSALTGIGAVGNVAWQYDVLARDIKKANRSYKKYIGSIVTIVASIYLGPHIGKSLGAIVGASIGATVGAKVNGASWGDALKAGGRAGLQAFALDKIGVKYPASNGFNIKAVVAHATVGGLKSKLDGGSFSKGAAYAAVGKVLSYGIDAPPGIQKGLTVAFSAGITAELFGGDFGDAALIAFVGYWANEHASNPARSIAKEATTDGHLSLGESNES